MSDGTTGISRDGTCTRRVTVPNESGPYLRGVRESLGLTRRQAAERIGCSVDTLARFENGGVRGTTSLFTVVDITTAYGISADTLLGHALTPL